MKVVDLLNSVVVDLSEVFFFFLCLFIKETEEIV